MSEVRELRRHVVRKLNVFWSPEQIAGRLKKAGTPDRKSLQRCTPVKARIALNAFARSALDMRAKVASDFESKP